MIVEKIDLYQYFNQERGSKTGGYLTTFVRSRNPENSERLRPAVLIIPGGAYSMVSWREGEPIAIRFMNEGYSAFCLEYTVQTPFPVPLIEAAMAMVYIRQNAKKYFVDRTHVAAVGASAGGHLLGMLSTIFSCEEVLNAVHVDAEMIRPDASVFCYPVISTEKGITHETTAQFISGNHLKLRERLSIDRRVTKNSVPAFIWHTADDEIVPMENSLALARAYKATGVSFELHIFESGVHGLSVSDLETANDCLSGQYNEEVQIWLPLAFQWLKKRGFLVR